jgi:hypothetical protein
MIDRDQPSSASRKQGRSELALLVQPRPRRGGGYAVYADTLGAPEVHVHARVAEDLRTATLHALGDEAIGMLLGQRCRDDYGTYVVVEHAVAATAGEHAGGRDLASMSVEGLASIRRRAAQRHPALKPVGWWRSHPQGRARFCPVDRTEPGANARGHDVAIVVAADHLDAAVARSDHPLDALSVYVGGGATLLARRRGERNAGSEPPDVQPLRAPASEQPIGPRGGEEQSAAIAGDSRTVDTGILVGIAVFVASGLLLAAHGSNMSAWWAARFQRRR